MQDAKRIKLEDSTNQSSLGVANSEDQILRVLIKGLPIDSVASTITEKLSSANFKVVYANIKAPMIHGSKLEYHSDIYSCVRCYVEFTAPNLQIEKLYSALSRLHLSKIKQLPPLIKKIDRTYFLPEILNIIFSYFHSPPNHLSSFDRDNSYHLFFGETLRDSEQVETEEENGVAVSRSSYYHISTILDSYYLVKLLVGAQGLLLNEANPWQDDKSIVMQAMRQNPQAFFCASNRLKKDKQVAMHVMRYCGNYLQFAPLELQDDKDVVLSAVKQSGMVLEYASNRLRNDKEVVTEALKHCRDPYYIGCGPLQFASEEVKKDKQVALVAIQHNKRAMRLLPRELKNDPDIVHLYVS